MTRRSLLALLGIAPAAAKPKPARVFWSLENRYHAPIIPVDRLTIAQNAMRKLQAMSREERVVELCRAFPGYDRYRDVFRRQT